jgi:hypothetical protein
MKSTSFIILFCVFCSIACKKQEEDVQVNITIENSPNITKFSRKYTIDETRFYLSDFQLVDDGGNAVNLKDLILVRSSGKNIFTFNLPSGNFSKFRYSFGLNKSVNNSNPSNFEDNHPLSTRQDMYWGMLKYRFIVTEGKIDSSLEKNKTPLMPFSMHLGSDTLYRIITTDLISNKIKRGSVVTIRVNLNKLFVLDNENFNFTNFSNHSDVSEMPKAIIIMDSLTNGIKTEIFSPN